MFTQFEQMLKGITTITLSLLWTAMSFRQDYLKFLDAFNSWEYYQTSHDNNLDIALIVKIFSKSCKFKTKIKCPFLIGLNK